MSTSAPRILICDDHELIREGLKRVLTNGGLVGNVGEAANPLEVLAAVRRERWDIVILDINLGGRGGMDVLMEIHSEFPRLPILMLSNYPEDQFALRSIREGASGYLSKNLASKDLIVAIRHVLSGRRFIGPKVAEQLVAAVQRSETRPLHSTLSNREDQVFRLISVGRTVGEIAAGLSLSVKTISTYRSIALRKLNLKNNSQLMRYALEHGLDS
jgi:DNA-binding NarL/FixJ family response regulator